MHLFEEVKRILLHIRFPVQLGLILGFGFGLLIGKVPFVLHTAYALFSWFLLSAGVTLFNGYYDKDTAPVAGLEHPPKATRSLLYTSIIFKLLSIIIASFISKTLLMLAVLLATLSICYSHPSIRLKSKVATSLSSNFIAGGFTFLAAALLNELKISAPIVMGAFGEACFILAMYLLQQIHQAREDKARKDISFTVQFGRKSTIIAALILMILGGSLALSALYLVSLYIPMLLLAAYIFIGLIALSIWFKSIKVLHAYNTMSIFSNYVIYGGVVIVYYSYFLL